MLLSYDHVYEDTPYIPSRDPREVNVVERLKYVQELQKAPKPYINDEEVQYTEMEREVLAIVEELDLSEDISVTLGVPGGAAPLNEDGVIDSKYLPSYVTGGSSVYTAATHLEFPVVGDSNMLYVATEENNHKGYLYRWSEENTRYERPYDSFDNISVVYGGSASVSDSNIID